jgi:hypothetical protein
MNIYRLETCWTTKTEGQRLGVSLELAVWRDLMFFCTFSIDRMYFFVQQNDCIVSSAVGLMRGVKSDR